MGGSLLSALRSAAVPAGAETRAGGERRGRTHLGFAVRGSMDARSAGRVSICQLLTRGGRRLTVACADEPSAPFTAAARSEARA